MLARIGSVGVIHAEIASASKNVRPFTNKRMKPAEMNHAMVMIGKRRMKSDSASFFRYAAGNSIPANMTSVGVVMTKCQQDVSGACERRSRWTYGCR